MADHEDIYLKANISTLAAQTRILKRLAKSRVQKLRNTRHWAEKNGMAVGTMPNYVSMTEEFNKLDGRRRLASRQARHVGLAYGFIRGRSYRQMEQTTYSSPYWPEVFIYIGAFSKQDPRVWKQRLAQWVDEGQVPMPKCQESEIVAALRARPAVAS